MCDCWQCCETEDANSFWADVYYYMEDHDVDKETAMKEITKQHEERQVVQSSQSK